MSRQYGYAGYHEAYNRLLVEDSRPLDSISVNQLPPGRHTVEVVSTEWGWNWLRLELEGRARRRIWAQLWSRDFHLLGARFDGTKPGVAGARLRGQRIGVKVELVGDVDVRVAADGQLLAILPDGGIEFHAEMSDLEDALGSRGLTRRTPQVTAYYWVSIRSGAMDR